MLYYQVMTDCNVAVKLKKGYYTNYEVVSGELYTEKEFTKIFAAARIKKGVFRTISLSSRQTFKMFGCRFPFHNSGFYIC